LEDRYYFDFEKCSTKNGFAQVDTSQDAWYFGTWANPHQLEVICYAEGDLSIASFDTPEEFKQEILDIVDWNREHHRFLGIDTGPYPDNAIAQAFRNIGLGEYIH